MQVAKVLISENRATVQDLKMITSGTVGATVAFGFDETWDGFSKTYVYKVDFKTRDVVDESGIIPPDLLTHAGKWLKVGVYGTKGDVVLPTVWADLGYICAGADPSGDQSTLPHLPVWAQLQQSIDATDQNVEELQKNLGKAIQVEPQDFTEEQQAQARENIGAVSQDDMAKATERLLAAERDFPVVCSASGEVVTVHDASDHALKGLTLYGKTTQDGTPTPETPIDLVSAGDSGSVGVNVCGKNLFNYPEWRNLWIANGTAVYDNNGVTLTATGADCYTDYGGNFPAKARIPISEGESVTLSWEETSNASGNVMIFPNGSYAGNVGVNNANVKSLTYTAVKGVTFVTFRFGVATAGTTISYKNIQVEHGNTATAFEPYKAAQTLAISTPNGLPGIPVSSGGNYTDANGQQWISDEIDFARGVYVQRVYTHTFTESDTAYDFTFVESSAGNTFTFGYGFLADKPTPLDDSSIACIMSDIATGIAFNDRGNRDFFSVYVVGLGFSFRDSIENKVDFDALKSMLPGRKTIYALAEPIETPLTAEEIAAFKVLHANKPNTTVYTDSNVGIKLDYVADTKTYIDNKFAELAAAIVNNT